MFSSGEVERFWPYIQPSVDRIVQAVDSVPAEDLDWQPGAADSNSLYALAAHALGDLEEQFLGVLSEPPADRDRDVEFGAARGSIGSVRDRWRGLQEEITAALMTVADADLDRVRRHPRRGDVTGHDVLIVVARHLAEHAGQAELTRDLLRATKCTAMR